MDRRIKRLIRANRDIAKYVLRAVRSPKWARSFLAYVYLYDPAPESEYVPNRGLFDLFPNAADEPVVLKKACVEHGNMMHEELYCLALLVRCAHSKSQFVKLAHSMGILLFIWL